MNDYIALWFSVLFGAPLLAFGIFLSLRHFGLL